MKKALSAWLNQLQAFNQWRPKTSLVIFYRYITHLFNNIKHFFHTPPLFAICY